MTNEFKTMIAELKSTGVDADTIASIEIVNEYMTNPDFKQKLNDYVFNATYNK